MQQYYLVEAFRVDERGNRRVIDTQAIASLQLEGAIGRLVRWGASGVVVSPISEELFRAFYQERRGGKTKEDAGG